MCILQRYHLLYLTQYFLLQIQQLLHPNQVHGLDLAPSIAAPMERTPEPVPTSIHYLLFELFFQVLVNT